VVDIDAAVQASGLARRFGDVVAVSGLDFSVPPGAILGVIGPSGSGKTTTIRMLIGSLKPSEGEVKVLGEDPGHFRNATREQIGYMPQLFNLYPELSVRENVDFVATLFGLLWFRRRRRSRAVLELLGLWDKQRRRAKALSGGEQRRLELACALVHEPRLLILDEPTAGVDPLLRRTIWDEIRRLRDGGVTAIVTTQYVTEAEECDTVAVISGGRLIALETPQELRRRALGGEIIEVETGGTFDASTIESAPGVISVRQLGLRSFRAIVDDAGTATPAVVEAVAGRGGEVASSREVKPTFEEVFAALVEHEGGRVVGGELEADVPPSADVPSDDSDGGTRPDGQGLPPDRGAQRAQPESSTAARGSATPAAGTAGDAPVAAEEPAPPPAPDAAAPSASEVDREAQPAGHQSPPQPIDDGRGGTPDGLR
jgi:ABC-2 type transport system ATP-binding protein